LSTILVKNQPSSSPAVTHRRDWATVQAFPGAQR
jgi:hypothetical protein